MRRPLDYDPRALANNQRGSEQFFVTTPGCCCWCGDGPAERLPGNEAKPLGSGWEPIADVLLCNECSDAGVWWPALRRWRHQVAQALARQQALPLGLDLHTTQGGAHG
jgi:hypothetical protein